MFMVDSLDCRVNSTTNNIYYNLLRINLFKV